MNNPPTEITTPPEGYEWTGEIRRAGETGIIAEWTFNGWAARDVSNAHYLGKFPILRKIKPPTVMVELPRDVAESRAQDIQTTHGSRVINKACRTALENEE